MSEKRDTNHAFLDGKVTEKTDKQFHAEIVKKGTKLMEQAVNDSESLVSRAKEANEAIDYLATHYRSSWIQFQEEIKESLNSIRSKRAAIEIESKQMLSAFSDVRKFFLDDRHEKETARLADFVDICERLKALKDSGFLDTVADTILRIESKEASK